MNKKVLSRVRLCNPMDYIAHGILQAKILEWVAFSFSRGSFNPGIKLRSPHCRWILYWLSHQVVKEAARNLTNRDSRICQHLSNSWENWLSNCNWMPWVLPFLGPLLLLTLILTFGPCLMCLFSKFLQDHLHAFTNWTINELLLTHSGYQKLWPLTNPLDPHSSLFFSYPHNATVPRSSYRRLTFGPYPKSKRLEW